MIIIRWNSSETYCFQIIKVDKKFCRYTNMQFVPFTAELKAALWWLLQTWEPEVALQSVLTTPLQYAEMILRNCINVSHFPYFSLQISPVFDVWSLALPCFAFSPPHHAGQIVQRQLRGFGKQDVASGFIILSGLWFNKCEGRMACFSSRPSWQAANWYP